MTYKENLVVAIKAAGQVLREADSTVSLPFGSEYSVLVKNLNSKRIQISVSIDGQDVCEGRRLIISGNSELELERSIHNGNLGAGNRFKFVERNEAIEQHRGIRVDDGLIRVEAWTEAIPNFLLTHTYWHQPPLRRWDDGGFYRSSGSQILRSSSFTESSNNVSATASSSGQETYGVNCSVSSDAGITVPGSESHQQFYNTAGFPLESYSNVIVLRLRGAVAGVPVSVPITVKTKPVCVTCGNVASALDRFCPRCGTALSII